jgi:hypothetical protein
MTADCWYACWCAGLSTSATTPFLERASQLSPEYCTWLYQVGKVRIIPRISRQYIYQATGVPTYSYEYGIVGV